MRLTANLHVGLLLGIATTGVLLALSGCAAGGVVSEVSANPADPDDPDDPDAALAQFSEGERERILAVQEIVGDAARTHELEPSLINAIIWVESRFDPRAKSPAGARGLMQLMPATAAYLAKRMGENNARAYDPEFNVNAGALYLAQMLDKFGDERLAVAAYHAGPGNVKRWVEAGEDFPDYSDAYVAKVMDAQSRFTGVDAHGRSSASRNSRGAAGVSADEFDELDVPDVDSLPDAADIHGIPRVIYERPQTERKPEPAAKPKPKPKPEPVAKSKPRPKPEPKSKHEPSSEPAQFVEVQSVEPVFVVHPELDARPNAAPDGWAIEPSPKPERPEQPKQPEPEQHEPEQPTPEPEQPKTGLGVLPDL